MVQMKREELQYENHSKRYMLRKEDLSDNCFQLQYCELYRVRVETMKARILENAKNIIDEEIEVVTLDNVEMDKMAFVIGTIEKRIKARPSVLKDLAIEEALVVEEAYSAPVSLGEHDFLEFEDEKQIVKLTGRISFDEVATGCTCGLYGKQIHDDVFEVEKVIWPLPTPQRPLPKLGRDAYVVFLSGLDLCGNAHKDAETVAAFSMMSRWISGELGVECQKAAQVVRVVIAGESIDVGDQAREYANAARYLTRTEQAPNVCCLKQLDALLVKLIQQVSVDLMSGSGDPAPRMMPQQPIHKCCLPQAGRNGGMLTLAPHPYDFSIGGFDITALSGHSVTDVKRLSASQSIMDVLRSLLVWQHLAPTCPDTVDGFPFKTRDPLCMEGPVPHVLVAGNQPEFKTEIAQVPGKSSGKTLLISVPKFSKSKTVVLLNLKDMSATRKCFGF